MAASAHDLRLPWVKRDARTTLRLNAIASLAVGMLMLVFAGPLARITGIGRPGLLAIFGAVLLVYGVDEFGFAVGRRLRRAHVHLFAVVDLVVIGGAILIVIGPAAVSVVERALIVAVAVVFGWFAIAEFRAARSM
jgi:hypothetical protein